MCNEMKVAIDKVAGANEQSEGEVRGWLMETRPKMGEKNCTRAAGKSGGGQAGLWAAEMKRLQAVQSARELADWLRRRARGGSRRVLEYCRCRAGERANRCTYTHKKDTWYRRRRRLAECVEPVRCAACGVPGVITRCRRIVTLPGRCMLLHHIRTG